jgi:hypothetical protein
VGTTSNEVVAKNLTNGTLYACAIAPFDTVGNNGKLSTVYCGTPAPVDDFFKTYRDAGGQAGGGYCSFGQRSRDGVFLVALFGVGLALFTRRRGRGGK